MTLEEFIEKHRNEIMWEYIGIILSHKTVSNEDIRLWMLSVYCPEGLYNWTISEGVEGI
jgi:hypothetical protein